MKTVTANEQIIVNPCAGFFLRAKKTPGELLGAEQHVGIEVVKPPCTPLFQHVVLRKPDQNPFWKLETFGVN